MRSAPAPSSVATTPATAPTNVLIVGVGGQGVVMVSKMLAEVCQLQGLQVKQSEVHGMAKRGGGVFSHVRFGPLVWSPTIPKGEADVLLALEWADGLRWLSHLDPERGTFIADTQRIVPPFACRNRRPGAVDGYARETPADIFGHLATGYALDASGLARELGNERAANTVLLGALSTTLDFPVEDWLQVLERSVPPHSIEANRAAFLRGRAFAESGEAAPAAREAARPAPAMPEADVRLEIVAAWCKGCDICVKMCPERCLALDDHQIITLTDAAACTGCRICEWLCPDFAIAVHREGTAA